MEPGAEMRGVMKTTREMGIGYLIAGIGLGLAAGLLVASRSRAETWEQFRRGATDGLDYLGRESEKVRAEADEFVGKTKEWLTRIGKSLRAFKNGQRANSGGSPLFD
jgi:hypothetical protein